MVSEMLSDEGRDEVVAVVVPRTEPEGQRVARRVARRAKDVGPKLRCQKFVGFAQVDEQRKAFRGRLDQLHRIPLGPGCGLFSEIRT